MAIQWFPGHMNVTKKAISDRMKEIDVVIELLDARLPGSSANPMLAQLTGTRRKLKILNKQDLADPVRTEAWLNWYNAQEGTRAIALDASDKAPAQRLIQACRDLVPNRGGMDKPVRVLICGVPNVGKSTLMNTLVGKKAAKTGDEAGITRIEQRINLASDFYLFDTPGMLWPKISVERSGYHLAASGAVGRNAYDEEEVALELLRSLKGPYPGLLAARYKLDDVATIPTQHDDELLELIARKRGAVMSGGRVNLTKAAEIVLNDYRSAVLGRITLETPEEFEVWWAEGEALEAERQRKKALRKKKSNQDEV
ncbi:MAG: ribosome biogenesis GTPase YlqF [Aquabacterium sp.]|uniref:ribosome biogenesis GTPase YlqF n=1 Tax=Aquabacterium sp. TaxID=1872578 RepID=UPI003BE691C5